MTAIQFFDIIRNNPILYIICLAVSLKLVIDASNYVSSSWLNPIKFNMLTFGIGFSIVIFLFVTGNISNKTFYYVLASNIIYWLIFIIIFNNKSHKIKYTINNENFYKKFIFIFFYSLYIALTIFSYSKFGIPIFNENSRLATYEKSGGYGLISRFSSILNLYSIYYLIDRFYTKKKFNNKLATSLLFLPIILFGILSGSRSSFLLIIFAFWGYSTFYLHKEAKLKNYKTLFYIFIAISITTFFLSNRNISFAFYSFVERIIASGDLYWESLPNETWSKIKIEKPFEFIFMGILGPLRILDATKAERAIGYQLTEIIYPTLIGKSTGPVALFPIFGLVCFGYIGGIIFSIFQSLLTSFLFRISYVKADSFIISFIFYYIFFESISFFGDISAGFGGIFNIIINLLLFVAILSIAIILRISIRKRFYEEKI
jgi:oligosaccharide repeat unit polymerase